MPGLGATLTHYVRLYQAPDHLLQVFSSGYSEQYKRFYFKDIQAILIRKTDSGKIFNAIWAVFAFFFAAIGLSIGGLTAGVLLVITAFFVACLLVNIAMSPTCVCHVRTAVQTEKLPNWRRVRAARKGIARIKPLIEAVQGSYATQAVAQPAHPSQDTPGELPSAPPVIQQQMPAPPVVSPAENSGNT